MQINQITSLVGRRFVTFETQLIVTISRKVIVSKGQLAHASFYFNQSIVS